LKRKIGYIGFFILLTAALTLLLVGCGRDREPSRQTEIAMTTHVTDMIKRVHSIHNNTELQREDIRIDAYYHDTDSKYLDGVKLHYNTDAWVFWDGTKQVHYYWPIEGSVYDPTDANITVSSLDFVGFCPFEAPAYITSTSYAHASGASFVAALPTTTVDEVVYMPPASQASLQEYLIAVLNNQTYTTQTDAGGALPLQFKHPFALIKFTIAAASGTHVQVDSIGIAELYTGGTCSYDGTTMSWAGTGSGTMMIQPAHPLKVGTEYLATDSVMVIPGSYVAPKTLTVWGTWDDWSNVSKDVSAEVAFNWQPGYIYTYNLTVTPTALKVDVEQFTEQW